MWLFIAKERRRQWQPTLVLLSGKSHGRRSLVGCSPWGLEESDTAERLHFYFSLSCTGEGNGNPLQCSCLENPRDGGAWWAAVYGVVQSRTWLKRQQQQHHSQGVRWGEIHGKLQTGNIKSAGGFLAKTSWFSLQTGRADQISVPWGLER